MKTISTLLCILTFAITKAQESSVYLTSHYTTDNTTSTYNDISFVMVTSGNYATLYIKDVDMGKWIIEDYPLELIETGFKDGVYFKKYSPNKDSSNFVNATRLYNTRGFYFFFDSQGGKIKSIAESIIYSQNNIITKRYYP